MFVVYHATQEFYGFLTSSGISQGMPPPSPFVSVATTALCLSITVFTYFRLAGTAEGSEAVCIKLPCDQAAQAGVAPCLNLVILQRSMITLNVTVHHHSTARYHTPAHDSTVQHALCRCFDQYLMISI
jgi:hypothetical protein